jgi:pullulanase/glycogen debranching enzyme
LLVLLNAHWDDVEFTLPTDASGWECLLDTHAPRDSDHHPAGAAYPLQARSVAVLRMK